MKFYWVSHFIGKQINIRVHEYYNQIVIDTRVILYCILIYTICYVTPPHPGIMLTPPPAPL